MASLITLKRRIKAAQNVAKTTKAMQMIAASKFKRAQEQTIRSRPYVEKLTLLSSSVMGKIENISHYPYLLSDPSLNKTLLLIFAPDKGLCGGLVTNLLREYFRYKKEQMELTTIVLGKKLEGQVAKLQSEVIATFNFGTIIPTFDMVYPLRRLIDDYYLNKKVGSVKVLYTNFKSVFTQTAEIVPLLPMSLPKDSQEKQAKQNPYSFEPKAQEILPELLSHALEMSLYQYLLESFASEQAARMIAMKNATENANDIIETLKLEYNKTRQAKITSEILDIAGGAVQN
jgi:F-type H+-transporting ATPase subunit gamma